MSRPLIVRPEAERELADAFDWYEERVPGLRFEFLRCADAALSAVRRNPRQFPQVHRSVRRALTRRFPYEVLFVDDEERIAVLAVFHAKRDPKQWQERT